MSCYHHLTTFDRARIETMTHLGMSLRQIAKNLGRSPSTISRERRRNANGKDSYQSEKAHEMAEARRSTSKPKGKWSPELAAFITEKLDRTWSPEQIVGRCFSGTLSFKTIYRWVYQGRLQRTASVLRRKGKSQKPYETRGRFTVGTSIKQRPKEIRKRETFGHWELDTVVSGRGKSKGCLATFIERKTRWYCAIPMPDRTAASMEEAIRKLETSLPKNAFQTATVDRGKEFACYDPIEKTGTISFYFADPYSSWQRGSNENGNGLLREFYPKGTDFACIDPFELARHLALINERPRKCLQWRTAHEAFTHELLHLN